MNIIVNYKKEKEIKYLSVENAVYLSDYAIRLTFNDGNEKLVDFKPFLTKSKHPSIKKYLIEHHFKQYKIVDGNLMWNDYDLIFPVSDLYSGKI